MKSVFIFLFIYVTFLIGTHNSVLTDTTPDKRHDNTPYFLRANKTAQEQMTASRGRSEIRALNVTQVGKSTFGSQDLPPSGVEKLPSDGLLQRSPILRVQQPVLPNRSKHEDQLLTFSQSSQPKAQKDEAFQGLFTPGRQQPTISPASSNPHRTMHSGTLSPEEQERGVLSMSPNIRKQRVVQHRSSTPGSAQQVVPSTSSNPWIHPSAPAQASNTGAQRQAASVGFSNSGSSYHEMKHPAVLQQPSNNHRQPMTPTQLRSLQAGARQALPAANRVPGVANLPQYTQMPAGQRIFKYVNLTLKASHGFVLVSWDLEDTYLRLDITCSLITEYIRVGDCAATDPAQTNKVVKLQDQKVRSYELQDVQAWRTLAVTLKGETAAKIVDHMTSTVITYEESPNGSVENVRTVSLQPESAQLAWDPPPCELRGGLLKHYTIELWPTAAKQKARSLTSTSEFLYIKELDAFTEYQVQVAYVNSVGTGRLSQIYTFTTSQGPPSAPLVYNFTYDDVTIGIVIVQPLQPNGPVEEYHVQLTGAPSGLSNLYTPLNGTEYIIGKLQPNTTYSIKVRARNAAGWGDWTHTIYVTTKEEVRPIPQAVKQSLSNVTCIGFYWVPPMKDMNAVSSYKITVASNDQKQKFESNVDKSTNSFIQCGLTPFTLYSVTVSVMKDSGRLGQPLGALMWTEGIAPPKPQQPVVRKVTSSTITIEIHPVYFNYGPITSYEIRLLELHHNHSKHEGHVLDPASDPELQDRGVSFGLPAPAGPTISPSSPVRNDAQKDAVPQNGPDIHPVGKRSTRVRSNQRRIVTRGPLTGDTPTNNLRLILIALPDSVSIHGHNSTEIQAWVLQWLSQRGSNLQNHQVAISRPPLIHPDGNLNGSDVFHKTGSDPSYRNERHFKPNVQDFRLMAALAQVNEKYQQMTINKSQFGLKSSVNEDYPLSDSGKGNELEDVSKRNAPIQGISGGSATKGSGPNRRSVVGRNKRALGNPPGVLWLELPASDVYEPTHITIGDDKMYYGRRNLPLKPDTEYAVIYVVKSTVVDVTKHSFTYAKSTVYTQETPKEEEEDFNVWLIVLIIVAIILLLLFLLLGFFVIRYLITRRRRGKFDDSKLSNYEDDEGDSDNTDYYDDYQNPPQDKDGTDFGQTPMKNTSDLESFFNPIHSLGQPRYINTMRDNVMYTNNAYPPNASRNSSRNSTTDPRNNDGNNSAVRPSSSITSNGTWLTDSSDPVGSLGGAAAADISNSFIADRDSTNHCCCNYPCSIGSSDSNDSSMACDICSSIVLERFQECAGKMPKVQQNIGCRSTGPACAEAETIQYFDDKSTNSSSKKNVNFRQLERSSDYTGEPSDTVVSLSLFSTSESIPSDILEESSSISLQIPCQTRETSPRNRQKSSVAVQRDATEYAFSPRFSPRTRQSCEYDSDSFDPNRVNDMTDVLCNRNNSNVYEEDDRNNSNVLEKDDRNNSNVMEKDDAACRVCQDAAEISDGCRMDMFCLSSVCGNNLNCDYNQVINVPDSNPADYNQSLTLPDSNPADYNQSLTLPDSNPAGYSQGPNLSDSNLADYSQGPNLSDSNLAGYSQGHNLSDSNLAGYSQGPNLPDSNLAGYRQGSNLPDSNPAGYSQGHNLSDSNPAGYRQGPNLSDSNLAGYRQGPNLSDSNPAGYRQGPNLPDSNPAGYRQGPNLPDSNPAGYSQGHNLPDSNIAGYSQGHYVSDSNLAGYSQGPNLPDSNPAGYSQGHNLPDSNPAGYSQGHYVSDSNPAGYRQGPNLPDSNTANCIQDPNLSDTSPASCNIVTTLSDSRPASCSHFPNLSDSSPANCSLVPNLSDSSPASCSLVPNLSDSSPASCSQACTMQEGVGGVGATNTPRTRDELGRKVDKLKSVGTSYLRADLPWNKESSEANIFQADNETTKQPYESASGGSRFIMAACQKVNSIETRDDVFVREDQLYFEGEVVPVDPMYTNYDGNGCKTNECNASRCYTGRRATTMARVEWVTEEDECCPPWMYATENVNNNSSNSKSGNRFITENIRAYCNTDDDDIENIVLDGDVSGKKNDNKEEYDDESKDERDISNKSKYANVDTKGVKVSHDDSEDSISIYSADDNDSKISEEEVNSTKDGDDINSTPLKGTKINQNIIGGRTNCSGRIKSIMSQEDLEIIATNKNECVVKSSIVYDNQEGERSKARTATQQVAPATLVAKQYDQDELRQRRQAELGVRGQSLPSQDSDRTVNESKGANSLVKTGKSSGRKSVKFMFWRGDGALRNVEFDGGLRNQEMDGAIRNAENNGAIRNADKDKSRSTANIISNKRNKMKKVPLEVKAYNFDPPVFDGTFSGGRFTERGAACIEQDESMSTTGSVYESSSRAGLLQDGHQDIDADTGDRLDRTAHREPVSRKISVKKPWFRIFHSKKRKPKQELHQTDTSDNNPSTMNFDTRNADVSFQDAKKINNDRTDTCASDGKTNWLRKSEQPQTLKQGTGKRKKTNLLSFLVKDNDKNENKPRKDRSGRNVDSDSRLVRRPRAAAEPRPTERTRRSGRTLSFKDEFRDLERYRHQQMRSMRFDTALRHPDRNRYSHVLAPDHSRVIVEIRSVGEPDYYNATYLDLNADIRYIAAQSPFSPATVSDFWRLVLQNRVETIVMMNRCVEWGVVKCAQYWAERGIFADGPVIVETVGLQQYADFAIRTLKVSSSSSPEVTVSHFQFQTWPVSDVPDDPVPLLDLRGHVRRSHGSKESPVVVHCDSGSAQSAVFIAVDLLIEQYGRDGSANVYGFVRRMRKSRPSMVISLRQYRFIYECLFEEFQAGDTVLRLDLSEKYRALCATNPQTGFSYLTDEFRMLTAFTPDLHPSTCAAGLLPENAMKNVDRSIVPPDFYRPYLNVQGSPAVEGYINAVFVDGFRRHHEFLVTQSPLNDTVFSFWRMVFDYQVQTIVQLGPFGGHNQAQYIPMTGSRRFEYLLVELINSGVQRTITVRNLKLCAETMAGMENRAVRHFQLAHWQDDNPTASRIGDSSPNSRSEITELLDLVMSWQTVANRRVRPIVVCCANGATLCGLLCCSAVLCERLREDKEVDLYHTVKHIKRRRPQFIAEFDQYRFLHLVLLEYIDHFLNKEDEALDGGEETLTLSSPEESDSDNNVKDTCVQTEPGRVSSDFRDASCGAPEVLICHDAQDFKSPRSAFIEAGCRQKCQSAGVYGRRPRAQVSGAAGAGRCSCEATNVREALAWEDETAALDRWCSCDCFEAPVDDRRHPATYQRSRQWRESPRFAARRDGCSPSAYGQPSRPRYQTKQLVGQGSTYLDNCDSENLKQPHARASSQPRARRLPQPSRYRAERDEPYRAECDEPYRAERDEPYRAERDEPYRAERDEPYRASQPAECFSSQETDGKLPRSSKRRQEIGPQETDVLYLTHRQRQPGTKSVPDVHLSQKCPPLSSRLRSGPSAEDFYSPLASKKPSASPCGKARPRCVPSPSPVNDFDESSSSSEFDVSLKMV